MQPETSSKTDLDVESPDSNINVSNGKDTSNGKRITATKLVRAVAESLECRPTSIERQGSYSPEWPISAAED